MRLVSLLPLTLVATVASAQEATVVAMTPETIAEAIAVGHARREAVTYRAKSKSGLVTVHLDTPFARVASVAGVAARRYATVTPEEIPEDALRPVLRVIVPPAVMTYRPEVKSIEHVVVKMPSGDVVQPISEGPLQPERFGNVFGATAEGVGIVATFPLDVLRAGNELRVLLVDGGDVSVTLDAKLIRQIR